MESKENIVFIRLHNIDFQSTSQFDTLLSDDYDTSQHDYSLENQLIGNSRRYMTEIESVDNFFDDVGKGFLDDIYNLRFKSLFEAYQSKISSSSRNVRTLEYIDSLNGSFFSTSKLDDINLKDFLQFRKDYCQSLKFDESITDFKLRISKFEYDFSEKKQTNSFNLPINQTNVQNSFNFNRATNLANQNSNQPKEEASQQNNQRNLLYKANNTNPLYGNMSSERTLPNTVNNNLSKPNNGSLPSTIKYDPPPIRSNKRRNEDEIDKEKYDNVDLSTLPFKSAREQLALDNAKNQQNSETSSHYSMAKRPMISNQTSNCNVSNNINNPPAKRGIHSKFNLPIRNNNDDNKQNNVMNNNSNNVQAAEIAALKNMDQKLIEIIMGEMMDKTPPVTWNHICGLEFQKETIQEIVIWPMMRPDIFRGLRGPPKGLLLFGPPGTGKTLFAKCIANESQSTFFNISASTLTSKWQGESEKLVKVLYEVARAQQPAVIFIDEIDSLLAKRSDDDRESSRRLKTEFFIQMDGAKSSSEDRILTIGATNRPQELDDAARRRFVKKLLIPLPEKCGRKQIITNLMMTMSCSMTEDEIDKIAELTDGYSGADMSNLCQEASLGPIRQLKSNGMYSISSISADQVRAINYQDFINAMQQVKASVSQSDLNEYYEWNRSFGSNAI